MGISCMFCLNQQEKSIWKEQTGKARAFLDRDMLTDALLRALKPGDVLLFKGSRGMHMELALDAVLKKEKETNGGN